MKLLPLKGEYFLWFCNTRDVAPSQALLKEGIFSNFLKFSQIFSNIFSNFLKFSQIFSNYLRNTKLELNLSDLNSILRLFIIFAYKYINYLYIVKPGIRFIINFFSKNILTFSSITHTERFLVVLQIAI